MSSNTMPYEIAKFHARALRDFCEGKRDCKECPFYSTEQKDCKLALTHPAFWEGIERENNGESGRTF